MGERVFQVLVLAVIACSFSSEVLAASADTRGSNTFGAGLFLAWAVAYLSRRRAIGGWLLYFYIQLYLSLLIALFFLPAITENLNPAAWDSSIRYVLFFLSTIPVLVTQCLEVFAATYLLFQRSDGKLRFLRLVLIALVLTSGIALVIDIAYFSDAPALFFDVLTFAFACIWTLYFWKAKRVRLVFVEKAWDYSAYSPKKVLTPEERRYLWKRAGIAACLTFVILLLMMGSALGDSKPDIGIFFVPTFYALLAAAIAWYVPIRKKKREALLGTHSSGETTRVVPGSGISE